MNRLRSFVLRHHIALLVLVGVLWVYGLSVHKKEQVYRYWLENADEYVVGDVLPTSSMDAYHWLKMARDLDEKKLGKGLVDPLRGYPDGMEYHDANLLAWLISLGKHVTGGDFYRSGLLLVSVLGGLFVFPLYFCAHRLGFGPSAVLGGLVGTFAHPYHQRTQMGYVDTDLLNLFFPLAVACFALPMGRGKPLRVNLALAAGAGAAMYLFHWWYEQPVFVLAYAVLIAAYLAFGRVPWRNSLGILLVFVLFSGPWYALQSVASLVTFLEAYFVPPATGRIVWPDVIALISEAQRLGPWGTLKSMHGFLPLVFAGFAGLLYLAIRKPREMILLSLPILLGLWSLVGPRRFAMYLVPFLGLGAGVVIELAVRAALGRGQRRFILTAGVSAALMVVVFFSTAAHTGYSRRPPTMLSAEATRALLELKERVPPHAAMFTSWDLGYPLMEIGEFATYHDGSVHGGLRTTLVVTALTSPSQGEMLSLLSTLEDHGFDALHARILGENLSGDELLEQVFSYPGAFRGENVYVLYTEDMIARFGGFSEFGTWDFEEQKADFMFYEEWACSARVGNLVKCKEGIVDMDRGVLTDGAVDVPLNAIWFVDSGHVADVRTYREGQKYHLQILSREGTLLRVQVVEDRLFRSNFNQQYLLGIYDERYFEEVYNRFPVARAFRVKPGAVREDR